MTRSPVRWATFAALLAGFSCAPEPPAPVLPAVPPMPPIVATAAPEVSSAEPAVPSSSSSAAAAPGPKISPPALKHYRVDLCYYAGFALLQGRDDYLSSLGKGRPGPGKVPVFVAISLSPAPVPVPFERHARACVAGSRLSDPSFGDVDVALAAFAPLATEIAKDLARARQYYETQEYQADGFALGNTLHDRLIENFKQLDGLHKRLGAAVDAQRKSEPVAQMEDGERLARAAVNEAREVLLTALAPKVDASMLATATKRLGRSIDDLKAWSSTNSASFWGKLMDAPLDVYRAYLSALPPSGGKRLPSASVHQLVHGFVTLVEARQRAIARAELARQATP